MASLEVNKSISDVVRRYAQQNILQITPVTGRGSVNAVYVVDTELSKYVLRVDTNEATLDRFKKEKWCISEAQAAGIPGPTVLELGFVDRHPYMLLPYVGGIDGDDVDETRQITIWAHLGEYACRTHSITVAGYGDRMVDAGVFDDSWDRFLNYNISSLTAQDKLLEFGIITAEQSQMLYDVFVALKSKVFTFGVLHHDLALRNTKITPDGTVHLLDWGTAEVSVVPHMEIAGILHSSLSETSPGFGAFLEHYGLSTEAFEEMKRDIRKLHLLSCTDKLRWALDRKPDRIECKSAKFKSAFAHLFGS